MNIAEKQKIEIDYWKNSELESPESDSIYTISSKMSIADVLSDCIKLYIDSFSVAERVLELGAGHGWASCIYKKMFPKAHVITTDISPFAIESLPKWEYIWNVKVDQSYACKSYETREASSSIDLIFCFKSAHHFVAHNRTLQEISRILKPNGVAFYLYEPACKEFIYPLAYKRVNNKRPEVPEDVLITNKIKILAEQNNLNVKIDYYPNYRWRGPAETVYYYLLSRVPFLQNILPCTTNFIFTKNNT